MFILYLIFSKLSFTYFCTQDDDDDDSGCGTQTNIHTHTIARESQTCLGCIWTTSSSVNDVIVIRFGVP